MLVVSVCGHVRRLWDYFLTAVVHPLHCQAEEVDNEEKAAEQGGEGGDDVEHGDTLRKKIVRY